MPEVGFFAFFIPWLFQKDGFLWYIKSNPSESQKVQLYCIMYSNLLYLLRNSLSLATFIKLASLFHSALTCAKVKSQTKTWTPFSGVSETEWTVHWNHDAEYQRLS